MKKYCVCCGNEIENFLEISDLQKNEFVNAFNIVGSNFVNYQCPICGCSDKERHLILFFQNLKLFENLTDNIRILHFAPEKKLFAKLYEKTKSIIIGDANPAAYKEFDAIIEKINLEDIRYPDNFFGIVIANYALELIENYHKALQEIFRVLDKNGLAILQTSYSPEIYDNFEDKLLKTPEKRAKFYGRPDYFRIFGLRLFDDIKQAGFDLYLVPHNELLKEYPADVYGVNTKENLILAIKPGDKR